MITSLLGQGYKVVSSHVQFDIVNLVLQNGSTVYTCNNRGAKYNNEFRCYTAKDYEPE